MATEAEVLGDYVLVDVAPVNNQTTAVMYDDEFDLVTAYEEALDAGKNVVIAAVLPTQGWFLRFVRFIVKIPGR